MNPSPVCDVWAAAVYSAEAHLGLLWVTMQTVLWYVLSGSCLDFIGS